MITHYSECHLRYIQSNNLTKAWPYYSFNVIPTIKHENNESLNCDGTLVVTFMKFEISKQSNMISDYNCGRRIEF